MTGWGDRIANHSSDEPLRPMPCKLCKTRCKTPVTPTEFYLSVGPLGGICPMISVGDLMGDYPRLNEGYRRGQNDGADLLTTKSL